jgi:hypothetical protein
MQPQPCSHNSSLHRDDSWCAQPTSPKTGEQIGEPELARLSVFQRLLLRSRFFVFHSCLVLVRQPGYLSALNLSGSAPYSCCMGSGFGLISSQPASLACLDVPTALGLRDSWGVRLLCRWAGCNERFD